jgi:D-xylose 1-dehydrogenase
LPEVSDARCPSLEGRAVFVTPEGGRQIAKRQCLPDRLQPSDMVRMVLFLAADDSPMCSSQTFIFDGGGSEI